MKNNRKTFYLWILLGLLSFYFLMLTVLLIAERLYGNSEITDFPTAIWYSLVTLTTVGYGDLVPVSPLGRTIGIVFLILSMGILATVVGAVTSFVTSEAFPLLLLSFQRDRNWYYFVDCETESTTLARHILEEDPSGVILFGVRRTAATEVPDYSCLFIDVSPAVLVKRKRNEGSRCKIFIMKENEIGSDSRTQDLYRLPVEVYARTTNATESLSGNIHFFHSYDCCARQYWQTKPLSFTDQSVVIIGFGNYGQAILERAILTNVWSPDQHVTYHIFGEHAEFLKIHYCLDRAFSMGQPAADKDALIFHEDSWASNHEILETADRIIICEDNAQKGWDIYFKLHNYYSLKGRTDLRNDCAAPGVSYFGAYEEIYTPQLVMRTHLNRAAITINELFRKSVSYPTAGWENLDDFLRQSKIASADHLLMKVRLLLADEEIAGLTTENLKEAYRRYAEAIMDEKKLENYRQIEHLRWCRFYYYYNWTYGPAKNDALRQHAMLRPYKELTPEQKAQRDHAWTLLNDFAEEMAGQKAQQ